jgi:hypothetical protein
MSEENRDEFEIGSEGFEGEEKAVEEEGELCKEWKEERVGQGLYQMHIAI